MKIRKAIEGDLGRIMELGQEFGHLMYYQKDEALMRAYLDDIIVAEDGKDIVGYYHYLPIKNLDNFVLLECYKQFPRWLLEESWVKLDRLCVCMQGASHREVFQEFIKWLQERYPEIWCWCSVKSNRTGTYETLGFNFNPAEVRSFFNVHKGGISTYRLGRWLKP